MRNFSVIFQMTGGGGSVGRSHTVRIAADDFRHASETARWFCVGDRVIYTKTDDGVKGAIVLMPEHVVDICIRECFVYDSKVPIAQSDPFT